MGVYTGLIRRLGHRRWFASLGARLLPSLDRGVRRLTGGNRLLTPPAIPNLVLHLAGRKPVPLLYARDGEAFVVAATNWGAAAHPVWSQRLIDRPDATVEMAGRLTPVTARLLDDAEVARVWPALLAVWPAFETYRERAGRPIRVFAMAPR
ncbi:MAG: nitroreductase/quinone reductase family protein [Acidimicrobiia bacterium]|nr:MAG: nitroreductase/quinone reductase family protein [Acidimicrobiia bacterium]